MNENGPILALHGDTGLLGRGQGPFARQHGAGDGRERANPPIVRIGEIQISLRIGDHVMGRVHLRLKRRTSFAGESLDSRAGDGPDDAIVSHLADAVSADFGDQQIAIGIHGTWAAVANPPSPL